MKFDLSGKIAVVSGGSSGIGRGIASSYIDKGANVCITGTRDKIDDYDEETSENIKKCVYQKLWSNNFGQINVGKYLSVKIYFFKTILLSKKFWVLKPFFAS